MVTRRKAREGGKGWTGDLYLARIVGRVVSTQKQDTLKAIPLQWLQPVDAAGEPRGAPLVAADTYGLGPGELCYYITAREASIALWKLDVAVDAAVVGKVERIDLGEKGEVRRRSET